MSTATTPAPEDYGRILLFTGGDPIAALVKWQTRSHYSHAALWLPGTSWCVESYPFRGVRSRLLTAADWQKVHAYRVPGMTYKQWLGALEFCRMQEGQGYDWRNVIRFLTRVPARENKRWFCSELVHEAISKTYRSLLNKPSDHVDPGDIPASPLVLRDVNFNWRGLKA
jgi:uncharacterized protein YycO